MGSRGGANWRDLTSFAVTVQSMSGARADASQSACEAVDWNGAAAMACILERGGQSNPASGDLRDLT
ncbi:replication initiation protein RepC [Rhizobium sp. Leaf371]|uniref:replication initiation protein RepC n=1 Tax=Rhizobium sp. Leaf371 TaxID=1736355 RepID=UPI003241F405